MGSESKRALARGVAAVVALEAAPERDEGEWQHGGGEHDMWNENGEVDRAHEARAGKRL